MKAWANSVGFAVTVLGCVAIGAWLVVQGHPWFALLVFLMGGSVSFRSEYKAS